MSRPRLVILGPQGVDKGTQSALLASVFDVEHLSTGELLRRAVRDGTPVGRRAQDHIARGDLVPDDLVLDVVEAELARLDGLGRGYVLDGFPRTVVQAVALAAVLPAPLTAAIELSVPLDALLDRVTRRRVCPGCGRTVAAPAGYVDAVACPSGDGIAVRRADDTPAALAQRLALYDRHAQPLASWFAGVTRLVRIDGDDDAARVHGVIVRALRDAVGLVEAAPEARALAAAP